MCGIFVVITDDGRTINQKKSASALGQTSHRGPDSQSSIVLAEGRLLMGHALLRISGKTVQSSLQPMSSPSGRYTMIYNGEVYNVNELKNRLKRGNNIQDGICDTRLLLEHFDEFGISTDSINHIDGMFAICIYDRKHKKVVLIRDHAGIKPLFRYQSRDGKTLSYSSEIKSFIEYFGSEVTIDQDMIGELLRFKYIAAPKTIWKGVEQIQPGHMEEIPIKLSNKYTQKKWYQPCFIDSMSLESKIKISLTEQLSAQAKKGLQRSGGLDSKMLYDDAHNKDSLSTFSAIFPGFKSSEKQYVDLVRSRFGDKGNHHEVILSSKKFYSDLTEATWFLEEPMVHQHTLAISEIAKCAKNNDIRVMISGEGADELFAGYHWQDRYDMSNENNIYETEFLTESEMKEFTSSRNVENSGTNRKNSYSQLTGNNINFQYEVQTHLANLLSRQDRMMMRYSVENRVPYLSRLLFDQAFVQSDYERYSVKKGKKWIKNSLIKRGYSSDFTYRPKIGFRLPYNIWNEKITSCKLSSYMSNTDLLEFLSINRTFLESLASDEKKPRYDRYKYLWLLEAAEAFVTAFQLL